MLDHFSIKPSKDEIRLYLRSHMSPGGLMNGASQAQDSLTSVANPIWKLIPDPPLSLMLWRIKNKMNINLSSSILCRILVGFRFWVLEVYLWILIQYEQSCYILFSPYYLYNLIWVFNLLLFCDVKSVQFIDLANKAWAEQAWTVGTEWQKYDWILLDNSQNFVELLPKSDPVPEIERQVLIRMHVNSEPHPFWDQFDKSRSNF